MTAKWTMLFGAVLLASAGCAAAGPPKGPKHVPSNTAEAETACPSERKQAQAGREALLGSNDAALSKAAAIAVMAQGRCEAAAAAALPVPTGTQEAILAGLHTLRISVRDATGLFTEVRRYGDATLALDSLIRDAEVTSVFAKRVTEVGLPIDLEPVEGHAFRAELGEAAQTLRGQAELTVQQALASDAAEARRDELCALLKSLGGHAQTCLSVLP